MISLLKNCLLSNNKKVNILIKDNVIEQIMDVNEENNSIKEYNGSPIDAIFDIKNNLVMPGFIDAMSRIINPSTYSSSNYESESKACAYGGITTFVDFSSHSFNDDKYVETLSKKVVSASQNSHVNFSFVVPVTNLTNLSNINKVHQYSVGTIIEINSRNFKDRINDKDKLNDILNVSRVVYIHLSGSDIDAFFESCENKETKLVFYDITNEADLEKIISYREFGFNIRTSTSINYLLFNNDSLNNEYKRKTITTEFKLGSMINNLNMWNAVKNRKIDMITSDHIPITLIEKFETEKKGLPNFETLFSILFDNCFYKRIPITILEDMLCKNPAKICGFKNKGEIKVGYDADLVVVNTTKRWWIKNEDIVSTARWTPFNDYRISGRVIMTFINGQLVYNHINQMMPIRNVRAAKIAEFED